MKTLSVLSSESATLLELARVVNVIMSTEEDSVTYGLDIATVSGRFFNNVPYMLPYVQNKAGVYPVPEKNSVCIVAYVGGQMPVVLGFICPISEESGDWKINKEALQEGDFCIKTRSGNKIIVYSTGKILIEATPAANIHVDPVEHTILMNMINLIMVGAGGVVSWSKTPKKDDTNLAIELYSKKAKQGEKTTINIGAVGDVVNINVNDKFTLHIDKNGNVDINTTGKINMKASEDITIESAKNVYITGAEVSING